MKEPFFCEAVISNPEYGIVINFCLLRHLASNSIAKIASSSLIFRHKAVFYVTIPFSLLYSTNLFLIYFPIK